MSRNINTYLSVNTEPLWLLGSGGRVWLHPTGTGREGEAEGGSFLSSLTKESIYFLTALLSRFFCARSHLLYLFQISLFIFLSPTGWLITLSLEIIVFSFQDFSKFPLPLSLFLHLFLTCLEHGLPQPHRGIHPQKLTCILRSSEVKNIVSARLWSHRPGLARRHCTGKISPESAHRHQPGPSRQGGRERTGLGITTKTYNTTQLMFYGKKKKGFF